MLCNVIKNGLRCRLAAKTFRKMLIGYWAGWCFFLFYPFWQVSLEIGFFCFLLCIFQVIFVHSCVSWSNSVWCTDCLKKHHVSNWVGHAVTLWQWYCAPCTYNGKGRRDGEAILNMLCCCISSIVRVGICGECHVVKISHNHVRELNTWNIPCQKLVVIFSVTICNWEKFIF